MPPQWRCASQTGPAFNLGHSQALTTWIQQQNCLQQNILFVGDGHLRHLQSEFPRDSVQTRRDSKFLGLGVGALKVVGEDDVTVVWSTAKRLVETDDVEPRALKQVHLVVQWK